MNETDTELTKDEYNLCVLAITRCNMLMNAIKTDGGFDINKDTFKFPDMTSEEEKKLCMKLFNNAEIAWLKETMRK